MAPGLTPGLDRAERTVKFVFAWPLSSGHVEKVLVPQLHSYVTVYVAVVVATPCQGRSTMATLLLTFQMTLGTMMRDMGVLATVHAHH